MNRAAEEAAYWQRQAAMATQHAIDFREKRAFDAAGQWQKYAKLNAAQAMKYLDMALQK